MKGKKTDTEMIYKVMLSYISTRNYRETARQLEMPATTVEKIIKENKDKPEFVQLCVQKKDEFIEKADRVITKALNRLEQELDNKDRSFQINNLSTVIGTLYDKKALAQGEPTANMKLSYEEAIKKVADENDY